MRSCTSTLFSTQRIIKKVLLCQLLCVMALCSGAQTWSSAYGFGSAPGESGRAVCSDASGNVYYIGVFGNTIDFDPGGGTTNLTAANSDVVISKYNAAGVFQWAVKGGGVSADVGIGIATDGTNVYATGTFNGTATFGAFPIISTGGTDVFVVKLSAATGAFTWAAKAGGLLGDGVQAICIDGSGNPYIIGTYNTSITLAATTLNVTGGGGTTDMFVAKFDTNTGIVLWGNGGGSSADGDNSSGAGICYVPGLNEIVITGSYSTTNATYGAITLNISGDNDLFLLEMNAGTGAFLSGVNVSTNPGSEEGLAVCYDAFTQDVMLTGYFDGATATFGSTTLTDVGGNDLFVARYSPSGNNFVWAVKPTGGTSDDRGYGICSNGLGQIMLTGQFESTINFGSTALTAASAAPASDIFVAALAATDGSWQWATKAGSTDATLDEIGRGVSVGGTAGRIAVTGQFAGTATFGALPSLIAAGTSTDIFIAQLIAPLSGVVVGTNATCVNGCNGSATVTASGGTAPYTYSWSPSGGTAATATGLCVGTYTVTITDNASVNIQRNVSIGLPTTQLATGATSNTTFSINASNTNIYDASCNLIATVVPTGGGTAIAGNVTARVWIEGSVPVYPAVNGQPYVARHYEITPATNAATATGTVTLYFTQAEFNAFNAAAGSTLDLPTGPADNARKANLRITKFSGATNNTATGLPGTYTNGSAVIDPVDASIVWNGTLSRWEVTFSVIGFSGFFVQTYQFALPLTWLDLKGFLDAENHTVINWKVDEQQVVSYAIEKSVNGGPYTTIGTVVSAGNGEHAYSFREAQALSGTAAYRIKQTDMDGRFTYSRILLIRQDKDAWITLYPNPVKQSATLNITDQSLMNTRATLTDGTGRLVQSIQIQQSVTTIDMSKCSPGVYTLRLQGGRIIKILKE